MPDQMETYNIKGVEVFSAGKWNNDKYEVEDLHNMVTAFNSLKSGFSPYLKLGHDDKQELAKSSGLPSVGWIENLYVQGQKLLADFVDIPKEVFKLIKSKAYRKVSSEIYWNLDVNGTTYPRVLSAVALLGAETPGVMNLQDILGQYAFLDNKNAKVYEQINKNDNFKAYEVDLLTDLQEKNMSEKEKNTETDEKVQKLEAEATEQKTFAAKLASEKSELEKLLDAQKAELQKANEQLAKAQEAERAAKVAKFVNELEAKKLATPSMKDHITQLMSDKKEYSLKDKEVGKEQLITEMLELATEAAKVNFTESSQSAKAEKSNAEDQIQKDIEKYSLDNKVSYKEAYKAVLKDRENAADMETANDEEEK